MEKRNFFDGLYDDFFGIDNRRLEKENEKLRKELGIDKMKPAPEIVVKKDENFLDEREVKDAKEDRDKKMEEWFSKIEKLYITDDSKNLIKKIIEYMRKYNEKIEANYISFNIQLISNNQENIETILAILEEAMALFNYGLTKDYSEVSMYRVKNDEQIEELYEDRYGLIFLTDLKGFEINDSTFKEKFSHTFSELVRSYDKTITILGANKKEELDSFFAQMSKLKTDYFDFVIEGINPDVQDVYNEVLEIASKSVELSDDMKVKLLDYIVFTYPKTELSFPEYRKSLCKDIAFNKEIPTYEREKTLDEIFGELNELVGLQKVKKVLHELVDLMELRKKAKDSLDIKSVNLHMVFLGNPGTGKTTVARIVAEILYNLKYIKQNKLIEVSSKDLVGEYVGQTAPKTMGVIEKAMGGLLFIDEAYTLASSGGSTGNSFNEEAIATLIQAMENYRDNLVVIFAGYTKEMQAFLNTNSGIVSRIGYTLEFDDYTTDELISIFNGMMKKSGFTVEKDALEELRKVIDDYRETENFGNARFVRNVYEKTIIKHASNTKNKTSKKSLKTISKEDISTDELIKM
ncbi:MAG: AAA family ATPase [Clostridia bacterium]|nr:AAA family ATPase [Clostridia bacterium]